MRLLGWLLAACVAVPVAPAFAQSASQQVADEVMAITKAEWAAYRQKNMTEGMKSIADDCTQFDGATATRVEGKALLGRLAEAGNKDAGSRIADEMLNPKVQVYGDVAILSYNFFGLEQDKDGKVKPNRAKSTRVYAKQGGKWMLVHANFAPDPLKE